MKRASTVARGAYSKRNRKGIPSGHRVKIGTCYDVAEVANLLEVHRNTVRHWLKQGLRALDDKRPLMIHGSELKCFLVARKQRRRVKCAPDELYCFRCRAPRKPCEGVTEVTPITAKTAKVTAICGVCEALMHRMIRADAAPLFTHPPAPDTG